MAAPGRSSPDVDPYAEPVPNRIHNAWLMWLLVGYAQSERFLPQLVHDARVNGRSWHEIAHALGTSPDDAQLRFDPGTPLVDSRCPHDP